MRNSRILSTEVGHGLQGEERSDLIKELHRVKTDIFMEMIESKQLPLRPGVKRLVMEAFASGTKE